ncbi:hypothetical protein JST97_38465, partial [bacterium]|nr:hypothetical protein [bacterium]
YRIDQKISYLKERYTSQDGVYQDQYDSTGCGRGFLPETRRGFYKMTLDPNSGQPASYVARHEHIENGHSDETLRMQVTPDGGKTYERKFWMDGGGQITSYSETVKVGPDGSKDYQQKPDSKVNFTNWVRRNRSLQTLTGLSLGGGLGAWGGHALLGTTGAVLGGLLGANLVDLCVRGEQKLNNRSNPSRLESAIWHPVDQLRTGVHIGGALAGAGLVLAFAFAGAR